MTEIARLLPTNTLYLFCKSYSGDLKRIRKLIESINQFNYDQIPFYLSVPQEDMPIFQDLLNKYSNNYHLISDEEIILSNNAVNLEHYKNLPGQLSQQVVKSEFWRYLEKMQLPCNAYLCIDSESIFLRAFRVEDFMTKDGIPYTVMHQNKELIQAAENKKIFKVFESHQRDSTLIKSKFVREGPNYAFGPTPVVWSPDVWRALDEKFLQPKKITLWELIQEFPHELSWYGEALLNYRTIPLLPIEPLMRVYHYSWQYYFLRKSGESEETIKKSYLGILKQSNWYFEDDHGKQKKRKNILSKLIRNLKRYLSYYR
jgi:hypothetical protein